jgi:hypothetical protein
MRSLVLVHQVCSPSHYRFSQLKELREYGLFELAVKDDELDEAGIILTAPCRSRDVRGYGRVKSELPQESEKGRPRTRNRDDRIRRAKLGKEGEEGFKEEWVDRESRLKDGEETSESIG